MYILSKQIFFPPLTTADENGFLAIGGDLSPERLLEAYRNGIFPWYNEGEPICWWSPDPRCVLFPSQLHVSKSMQRVLLNGQFTFTINNSFLAVMQKCSSIKRNGQHGTWIHEEMINAYNVLYQRGDAFSAEAWFNGKLAGGLYGVKLGNIFFGESMFSLVPNASKYAFIKFVRQLASDNIKLIDCQLQTNHLKSLGAVMIPRTSFIKIIKENIDGIDLSLLK